MNSRQQITNPADAHAFVLAGNATITLVSGRTEARFTYKVTQCEDKPALYFVALLSGVDNEGDFQYLGTVRRDAVPPRYAHGKKSRISPEAPSARAFVWFAGNLFDRGVIKEPIQLWHEGRCCRCGRKLTVPESIERGVGPECAGKMGDSRQTMFAEAC